MTPAGAAGGCSRALRGHQDRRRMRERGTCGGWSGYVEGDTGQQGGAAPHHFTVASVKLGEKGAQATGAALQDGGREYCNPFS